MVDKKSEILNGSLYTGIIKFALPLALSNILQVLFNLSDVAIVGKFAGDNALGSVGSCTMLSALFTTTLIGFSSGMTVIIARYKGSGNTEKMRRSIFTSFIISCITGLLFLVVGVGLAKTLLLLIDTKEDLLEGAVVYMRTYFMALPACMLYNFGAGVYAAIGKTRKPLMVLAVSGVLNITLNYIFVVCFHLSTFGVGLSSCISQYLSAIIVLAMLISTKEDYRLNIDIKLFDRSLASQILKLCIPSGAQNALFYVGNLFIQKAVNYFPTTVVNGNSAATNADALIYDFMAAFYSAGASYMSQNYGAHNKKRILKSYLISTGYAFAVGMTLGILLYIFGPWVLSLFANGEDVIAAGMERVRIMALCYGFSAFMDGTIAACRALGKSNVPMIIVVIGSCLFRILWIYTIFEHFHTIASIYLLYIFSWTITAAGEIAYFIPLYKTRMAQLNEEEYYENTASV